MKKIKKIFHKFPDGFQLKIINIYNWILGKADYIRYHCPVEKRVRNFLIRNGVSGIRRIHHGWRIKPVFSQYYTGFYKGNKVFCKVYCMPDYGCIKREEKALLYIASTGNVKLIHSVPSVVASYQVDEIRILITEYIEGQPLKDVKIEIGELYKDCREILRGLSDNGIIHVDIRPDNFIITADRTVKLIDFGMAYVEKYESTDELYADKIFPAALCGTGCGRYNPADGIYDDAYAMLRTLKDIDPRFLRTCREGWMELNQLIGNTQICVKCTL